MKNNGVFNEAKPYLAVIFLQFGYGGMSVIGKFALNQGMNHYTFAVYRNVIAAAIFAPFAFFIERKVRPAMTISVFLKIMSLALIEPVIDQNLYYVGLKYTSVTFAVAMTNILPAITFIMAWILRMERVNIRRYRGEAKIVGTLVTVGGAMVMTLIQGPTIILPWTRHHIHTESTSATHQQDNIKGSLIITAACFCWASFYILQAVTLKSYPAELSLTSLLCMTGAMQGIVLTFAAERGNMDIWSIRWDTRLLAAVYSGIICSGIGYYVSGNIMKEKGPVFVTAFNPLSMVVAAILGSFILAEQLDLGRVVGAVVIVAGLYLVIWGKTKEESSSKLNNDQILGIDQHIRVANDGAKTSNYQVNISTGGIPSSEAV